MSTGPGWLIEDLPEEAPRRQRRIAGHWGLLILLAVLLTVTVAAGVRPRIVGGDGAMRVDLALPAPGDCLRWEVDVTDPPAVIVAHPQLPLPAVAASVAPASCDSPHQGQVVRAWRLVALDDQQAQHQCIDAASDVKVSSPTESSSGWSRIFGDRRASMVRTGTSPTDYVACVLIEIPYGLPPAVFTLSALMVPDTSTDPRWCLTEREQAIGCGQPHHFERIGIADEPRGSPSCRAFVRTLVGAPAGSATFSDAGLTIRSGMLPGTFGPTWFCDVVAPQGRQLTASVVGLGSAPPPLG